MRARCRGCAPPWGERGAVGGIEVLPFLVLVLVTGSLLMANLWGIIDAEQAVEHAAREGARAYVEAADPVAAPALARRAARDAFAATGRDPGGLEVVIDAPSSDRCAPVAVQTTYRVRTARLPFVGSPGGSSTVRGLHREIIDPFRSGGTGEVSCAG